MNSQSFCATATISTMHMIKSLGKCGHTAMMATQMISEKLELSKAYLGYTGGSIFSNGASEYSELRF